MVTTGLEQVLMTVMPHPEQATIITSSLFNGLFAVSKFCCFCCKAKYFKTHTCSVDVQKQDIYSTFIVT